MTLTCKKCGYQWKPRSEKTPKECPDCKSRYWAGPKKKQKKEK